MSEPTEEQLENRKRVIKHSSGEWLGLDGSDGAADPSGSKGDDIAEDPGIQDD